MIRPSAFGCLKIRKLKLNPGCRTVYPLKTVDRVDLLENLWSVWRYLRVPLVYLKSWTPSCLLSRVWKILYNFRSRLPGFEKTWLPELVLWASSSHICPSGKWALKVTCPARKPTCPGNTGREFFLSPVYNVYPLVRAYMPTPLFNRVSSSYLFIYRYLHKFWKLYIKFINFGIN